MPSREKDRFAQAQHDLKVARNDAEAGYSEWASFAAQQPCHTRYILTLVIIAALVIALAGCGDGSSVISPGSQLDYDGLVGHLRGQDIPVAELGEVSIPCFIVRPRAVIVTGGTLWVFEYQNSDVMGRGDKQDLPGYLPSQDHRRAAGRVSGCPLAALLQCGPAVG